MEDVRKTPEIVRIGTGLPGPGRPRGLQNKWTRGARAAMQMAFDEMGGVDALAEWGRKNPELFYPLYARLANSEPPQAVLDVVLDTTVDPRRLEQP